MPQFLWFSSGITMLVLIALIALRAFKELIAAHEPYSAIVAEQDDTLWPDWAAALLALAVVWLGVFAGHLLAGGSVSAFFPRFIERFTKEGDAPRYLFMAENGYVREGENVINIVFYPLYPLLIRLLTPVFGGHPALCAFFISQFCYLGAAAVFYRLAKTECTHPNAAFFAFILYPFGFFVLGVFTEGLFLLLSLSALYLLRKERWLWAGLCGFLCALTRAQGLLLLLPGVYLAWRTIQHKRFTPSILAVLGPMIGWLVYLTINRIVCGDFFAFRFYEAQEPWWQTAQWIGDTLAQQWQRAFDFSGIAKWIYWPQLFLYFIAIALLFGAYHRRQDNALVLYGGAYLGMCYTASWLISGGRYMLGCIPMFLAVGSMKRRWLRLCVLAAEFWFFLVFNRYFMQGQCIM